MRDAKREWKVQRRPRFTYYEVLAPPPLKLAEVALRDNDGAKAIEGEAFDGERACNCCTSDVNGKVGDCGDQLVVTFAFANACGMVTLTRGGRCWCGWDGVTGEFIAEL